MKLTNIHGFRTITEFVNWKLKEFEKEEKSFKALFKYMHLEADNTMVELTEGYSVRKISYGEMKQRALEKAAALSPMLVLDRNSIVGIYMDNSPDWISLFWAILICGYRPLLMNKRLHKDILEGVLAEHNVGAVISDGEVFGVKTVLSTEITYKEGTALIEADSFGDEVIFMSSGTTQNIKLCAYTAENFYYQLGDSLNIVKSCPQLAKHYKGEQKLLMLLPLYHVFGFIAVYMWFGFFSRTFVFLKDMNPKTIQSTVKRHCVTHIFAVPLVWESVYKAAVRSISKRGDKTYKKFRKAVKLSNRGGIFRRLVYKGLGEVREGIFGESICFLISGGGGISKETLSFFNGIGYHIANGYGMTEIGITSVDISLKASIRNLGSVGPTFGNTHYSINEHGELLIKGKTMASKIYQGGVEKITNHDEWFNSHDLAAAERDRYYILGRSDDLIVSASGENLNPQIIESSINLPNTDGICLLSIDGEPTLLISSKVCYSREKTKKLIENAKKALADLNLQAEIHRISITPDPLLEKDDFKLSRRKIKERYLGNTMSLVNGDAIDKKVDTLLVGLDADIRRIFAEVVQADESSIDPDANFFTDLGGSSLDYFILADEINTAFGIDIKAAGGKTLLTVNEICNFIKEY